MSPQNIIRLLPVMVLIILLLGFWLGCSRDEKPESQKKSPKVVQSIATTAAKKEQPVKESSELDKTEPAEEKEEKPKPEIEKSESKTIQPDEIRLKETIDSEKTEDVRGDKIPANLYTVKPGDNLALIAGRDDVFGDPLMWPILYRLNYEQLKPLSGSDNLPHRELSQGMKLNIITEIEQKRNLEEKKNKFWVVNVLSSPIEKEINQEVNRLIEKGYPVYIAKLYIEGKKWQRLRIGFFQTKNEADKFGQDMMSKIKLPAFWSAKIGEIEFGKYAGY